MNKCPEMQSGSTVEELRGLS